jgi:hypothetical protein
MNDMVDKKKVLDLIHTLGLKYKMTDEDIRTIVETPFLFTYLKIRELDLSNVETEEDLAKLKTNFLYKSFGKIILSNALLQRRNKQKNNGKLLNESKWKKKL